MSGKRMLWVSVALFGCGNLVAGNSCGQGQAGRDPDHSSEGLSVHDQTRVGAKAGAPAADSGDPVNSETVPLLPGAPPDDDYDHVVRLTGTQTGSSVSEMINSLGPGTVLVRPLDQSGATIVDGMVIPRSSVTLYGLDLTGGYKLRSGTVMWEVKAEPASFSAGGADQWRIRDSVWSGGAGSSPAQGCVGNVYAQNFVGGDGDDPAEGWVIENSTFKNYVPTESGCDSDHSEALFISARSVQGVIRNNVFGNNGNTAHVFFTWWGRGCTSYQPACSPDNICIEGNSFGQTWTGSAPPGAYYDISAREELPADLNIYVDPRQDASLAGPSGWRRACR